MSKIEQNLELFKKQIKYNLKTWGGKNQLQRAKKGILTETTELLEKEKKQLRGDKISELDYIKEYGDAIYYARVFQYLMRFDSITKEYYENLAYPNNLNILHLIRVALDLNEARNIDVVEENFKKYLAYYFKLIENLDIHFPYILNVNIEKLTKRANEGKIKGFGDNR